MTFRNGMMPVHPGEILRDEMEAIDLSANALSKMLNVPVNRITLILNGQRGISADTALRLANFFRYDTKLVDEFAENLGIASGRDLKECRYC